MAWRDMRARVLRVLAVLAIAAALPAANAQSEQPVARVGIVIAAGPTLFPNIRPENASVRVSIVQGLRERGWIEGQNLTIELRMADGHYERLPSLVAELARLPVHVIVAASEPVAKAAAGTTHAVPIVFAILSDPVRAGLVESLARPGGNLTGTSGFLPELTGKQLELLKEAAPAVRRVALLVHPDNPSMTDVVRSAQDAADALGIQLHVVPVREAAALPDAYRAILAARAQALVVMSGEGTLRAMQRGIGAFALTHRMALVSAARCEHPGCLMSYGIDIEFHVRRAAHHVDRILKGAKPADLPVERATKFHLAFNLATARAIDLAIPDKVIRLADEVID